MMFFMMDDMIKSLLDTHQQAPVVVRNEAD